MIQKENSIEFSFYLVAGHDSNVRPSGYEPDELPTAPPRDIVLQIYNGFQTDKY